MRFLKYFISLGIYTSISFVKSREMLSPHENISETFNNLKPHEEERINNNSETNLKSHEPLSPQEEARINNISETFKNSKESREVFYDWFKDFANVLDKDVNVDKLKSLGNKELAQEVVEALKNSEWKRPSIDKASTFTDKKENTNNKPWDPSFEDVKQARNKWKQYQELRDKVEGGDLQHRIKELDNELKRELRRNNDNDPHNNRKRNKSQDKIDEILENRRDLNKKKLMDDWHEQLMLAMEEASKPVDPKEKKIIEDFDNLNHQDPMHRDHVEDFAKIDLNGDGKLSMDELRTHLRKEIEIDIYEEMNLKPTDKLPKIKENEININTEGITSHILDIGDYKGAEKEGEKHKPDGFIDKEEYGELIVKIENEEHPYEWQKVEIAELEQQKEKLRKEIDRSNSRRMSKNDQEKINEIAKLEKQIQELKGNDNDKNNQDKKIEDALENDLKRIQEQLQAHRRNMAS